MSEGSAGGVAAVVGHDAAQNGEAGDQGFEEFPGSARVDRCHGATVGGRNARVARGIEKSRYGFVAIDALSAGGVLSVWKTTQ